MHLPPNLGPPTLAFFPNFGLRPRTLSVMTPFGGTPVLANCSYFGVQLHCGPRTRLSVLQSRIHRFAIALPHTHHTNPLTRIFLPTPPVPELTGVVFFLCLGFSHFRRAIALHELVSRPRILLLDIQVASVFFFHGSPFTGSFVLFPFFVFYRLFLPFCSFSFTDIRQNASVHTDKFASVAHVSARPG